MDSNQHYFGRTSNVRSILYCVASTWLVYIIVIVSFFASCPAMGISGDALYNTGLLVLNTGIILMLTWMGWLACKINGTSITIDTGHVTVREWYGKIWMFGCTEPVCINRSVLICGFELPNILRSIRLLRSGNCSVYIPFDLDKDVFSQERELMSLVCSEGGI